MKKLIAICSLVFAFFTLNAQSYPEMIKVEGGTFTMGDSDMEGEVAEQPAHEVTLKSFSMAKTETTVLQWKTFCSANGYEMPEPPSWGWIDNHPIVNVNYDDAQAYCDWLTRKTGESYNLPTEAEWEYAIRGGRKSKGFKYSQELSIDTTDTYDAKYINQTQAVAQKPANELGIYDLSDNVWEWCTDWYGNYSSEAQVNPWGPSSGSLRVLRGVGCGEAVNDCRVTKRCCESPRLRFYSIGFRVVGSK